MQRRFSVLLADPNPFLCQKIADVLNHQVRIGCVRQATDLTEFEKSYDEMQPDFVLADLAIWQKSNIANQIDLSFGIGKIALVDSDSRFYQQAAAQLGLDGSVEKGKVLDSILAMIRKWERE